MRASQSGISSFSSQISPIEELEGKRRCRWSRYYFPVIFAFALMSLKLFNSLRTMQIQMGVGVVLLRYESPLLFWFVIAFQCLVIGALLAIIYSVFCPSEPRHELRTGDEAAHVLLNKGPLLALFGPADPS